MNPDTISLLERPYQEIVDDILTAIVGGVVNEPIFHDDKEDLYPLSQPASDVRGITGTRTMQVNGSALKPVHYAFQKEIDFVFDERRNAIVWQPGGARPDDETTFAVDYYRPDSRSPLSDINVGSVTRTLSEAIGREIATVYQQINQAYLAGFIDTATGQSLDLVVTILGVERYSKELATGLVTFYRELAAGEGNITIPQGTSLSTAKGEATFVTTQPRTLQRGQAQIDVPIRASVASKGEAGLRKAGEITTLAQPILGIARVSNLDATILAAEGETDAELRLRAKAALRGIGKATLFALANAIFENRAKLSEVWDPNGPADKRSPLGTVKLLIETPPERFASIRAAVEERRAAGVLVNLVARYVYFKPWIQGTIAGGIPAAGKDKIKREIIQKLQTYINSLSAGTPAQGEKLLQAIQEVKEISDPHIKEVNAWRSAIGQPTTETLIDALLNAINTTPTTGLREAMARVIAEKASLPSTNPREPDRGLIQGPSGQQATDAEIEEGKFQISALVNGEKWWVVLDIEPANIDLREKT